ncbi:MAG: toll/interleukin-1 receptor domain-containing protein [Bryobacteraceae bacterium]
MEGADLSRANFVNANLSQANLRDANLRESNFRGSKLSGAEVQGANLRGAFLQEVGLNGLNLVEVNFNGANLTRADLRGANLQLVNLCDATLNGTKLAGADITGARLGWTVLGDVDLSDVRGLASVRHTGPSSIGIDTIFHSKGKVPENFLRGCGAPEQFITYVRSLMGRPIEFYSCFISYSARDQEFADRLYTDLHAAGVRCWFAPEHLKVGDKFRDRIDESIRIYDKLLIILSKNSVQSSWVATEVEAAFEREHKEENVSVLFPIRLDDRQRSREVTQ